MKKKILFISFIFLLLASTTFAGDISRIGTTSGSQLLIPVGARSIALGSAVVSEVKGAEAIYYNPAGMAATTKSEILFNNMTYIADIKVNYFAGLFSGGNIGSFGLSIKSLDFGDIAETTEIYPDGTGDTYSPSFVVLGLSYSRMLTDRISAGLTGKYISEKIMETSASALAIDLGVQYSFNNSLKLGVVMKNVGSKMQYDGRNLERTFTMPGTQPGSDNGYFRGVPLASDIPSIFSFGLSYAVNIAEENSVRFSGEFANFNDASDQVFGGMEYGFKDLFFLRGGYTYDSQSPDDQIFGVSAGAGIKYPVGNFDFYFDYAYRQLTDYFDANHVFTVKLGL